MAALATLPLDLAPLAQLRGGLHSCSCCGSGADLELYYTFCSGGRACAFDNHGGTTSGLACLGGAPTRGTTSEDGGGQQ